MKPHPSEPATHRHLMHQMGSPTGYDPIPPDQYLYFLNPDETNEQRLLAWVRSKTIRARRAGRTPFARDERGDLSLKHAAVDLGMQLSNASRDFAELESKGLTKRDDAGRLWLCGKVSAKRRTDSKGEEKAWLSVHDNLPTYLIERYQQLDQKQRTQFDHGYLELKTWGEKVEADAIAAARQAREGVEDQFLSAFGMQRERRQKKRQNDQSSGDSQTIQFSLLRMPQLEIDLRAVQITNGEGVVQNGSAIMYATVDGGVHEAQPLGTEDQSSQSEVKGKPAPETDFEGATHFSPHLPPVEAKTKAEDEAIEIVEALTGKRLKSTDPLRAKLIGLADEHQVPTRTIARFLAAKAGEKRKNGYEIHSAGALHKFATEDLAGWLKQNSRAIEADRQALESERSQREQLVDVRPETDEFLATFAVKKGMR